MNVLKTTELRCAVALACWLVAAGGAWATPGAAPGVAMAPVAQAAAPAGPVTLVEYLALVRHQSPALRAEALRVDAARADVRSASALPNPTLSYGHRRGEREAGLEQPLPIFGQRGARIDGARLGVATTAAQVDAAAADVLYEAARDFIALLVAQERQTLWAAAQSDLAQAAVVVDGQVQAGARSRYDRARIELQQAQMAMELAKARAMVDDAAAKLASAAALPQWRARAVGSLQTALPGGGATWGDGAALWAQAQQRLPAVRAALAAEAQAEQRIALERREALPTPAVGLSRVRHDADGRYSALSVSVEIPLFDRRQGAIERAQAERAQAQWQREAVVVAAQAELQRALEQWRQRQRLAQTYEQEGLAQLGPLRTMAQDAYLLGQSTILELIDAISAVAERKMEYLELVHEVLLAEWDVRAAAGEVPGAPL